MFLVGLGSLYMMGAELRVRRRGGGRHSAHICARISKGRQYMESGVVGCTGLWGIGAGVDLLTLGDVLGGMLVR